MRIKYKKHSHIFSILIAGIAVFGGLSLSYDHFSGANACPLLFSFLPACYMIAGVFLIIFLGIIFCKSFHIYLIIFGVLFAGYASIGNIGGFTACPQTTNGIPMCYIAFSLFLSLFFLEQQFFQIFKIKNS